MSDYRELMRRKLLMEAYSRMSPEEKHELLQLQLLTNKDSNNEVLRLLQSQDAKIDDISRKIGKYPFANGLLANVAGNAITDGLAWMLRSLCRKL